MSYVIYFHALASGQRHPDVGRYLKAFDPTFMNGRGRVVSVREQADAKVFDSKEEAFKFWQQDTAAGRPLTAFTVQILPVGMQPVGWRFDRNEDLQIILDELGSNPVTGHPTADS